MPTLKEQGIDAVITGWHGLFAPAETPEALLDTTSARPRQAMKDPGGRRHGQGRRGAAARAHAAPSSPSYIVDEHAFWGKKLKALKIEME